MITRRSLSLPIALAVVMIVLLVTLTVGWVILLVRSAYQNDQFSGTYWALLSIGSLFFGLILVGVVVYLTLSIKAINLSQRQSNFIDSVTHELKSPIASLKLYLQTLSRRTLPPDEQQHFYGTMLEDVERLDQLINHLLDAARMERLTIAAEPEVLLDVPAQIQSIAQGVCVRYQKPAEAVTLELEPCHVRLRRVEFDLVVRNLIDNAVKYCGDPPKVTVAAWPERDRVVIRITDNGRGIPAHLRNKVFGRFVRLGTELERDKPGTGLGLYLVRAMVRRLRGQIRLTAGPQGTGTMCLVKLRRATAESVTPPGEPAVAAESAS